MSASCTGTPWPSAEKDKINPAAQKNGEGSALGDLCRQQDKARKIHRAQEQEPILHNTVSQIGEGRQFAGEGLGFRYGGQGPG